MIFILPQFVFSENTMTSSVILKFSDRKCYTRLSVMVSLLCNFYHEPLHIFSVSSLSALSKTFKMGSIAIPSRIVASPLRKICRD